MGRGWLVGEGVVSGEGVVTFQSVDRCTHEYQGFLSRQRHLDGRLRDHQLLTEDGVTMCATASNFRLQHSPGSAVFLLVN